jgi:hypothetical protein
MDDQIIGVSWNDQTYKQEYQRYNQYGPFTDFKLTQIVDVHYGVNKEDGNGHGKDN